MRNYRDGRIYVLHTGGGWIVKRVVRDGDGWFPTSDKPS